jgi:uncharacterized tellurite resistance protein B-like protein
MEAMGAIEQLKALITLARADGQVAESEKQFIINIGQANHLLVSEILPMFSEDYPLVLSTDMTDEEKFEYVFRLVQLMKIDEKLYRSEIKYCASVAASLGYQQDVIFDLMLNVKKVPMDKSEKDILRAHTAKFLNHI